MFAILAAALWTTAARAQDEISGTATHYGVSYQGSPLACGGRYDTDDPTIAAVGPSRYAAWPCGTELQITGPAGSIVVTRQDSCPGCGPTMIDLSEAGSAAVCGAPAHTCSVTIREVK